MSKIRIIEDYEQVHDAEPTYHILLFWHTNSGAYGPEDDRKFVTGNEDVEVEINRHLAEHPQGAVEVMIVTRTANKVHSIHGELSEDIAIDLAAEEEYRKSQQG
jgi:hypothetical protein